jgi:hypothetical protein
MPVIFQLICIWGPGPLSLGKLAVNDVNWEKLKQKYPWLYDSVVHQGYLCKFRELFCGHSSSSQECVTVGINLPL